MQVNPFTLVSKNKFIVEDYESLAGHRREAQTHEPGAPWEDRLYKDSGHASRYGFIPRLLKEAANESFEEGTQEKKGGKLSSTMSTQQLNHAPSLPRISQHKHRLTHAKTVSTNSLQSNEKPRKSVPENHAEEKKPAEVDKLKKDTLKEYINRKREIFLSKMNIDLKTKATDKLSDFIQNQEEGLNATISDMRNDAKMVNYFIQKLEQDVKNDAANLKKLEKEKNDSHNMFIRIKNETQIMHQSIKNIDEELKIFQEYRLFIIAIAQYADIPILKVALSRREVDSKPVETQEGSNVFLTAAESKSSGVKNGQFSVHRSSLVSQEGASEIDEIELKINEALKEIMESPADFLGILRKIEEENLRIIEKTQNMAEDLTVLDRALEKSKSEYKTKLGELEKNMRVATKQKEELEKEILSRKDMKHRNFESSNAMKINDSSKDLDPTLMCNKIKDIFTLLFPEKRYKQDIRDLDRIEAIEKEFEKYKKKEAENLRKNKEEYIEVQQMYFELMKKAGNEKSREKTIRQQEENKRKQKEKFEKPIVVQRGRKDVFKHKIKKQKGKVQDDKIDFEKIEEERFCSWAPITQTEQLKYFDDMKKETYLSKHGVGKLMESEVGRPDKLGGKMAELDPIDDGGESSEDDSKEKEKQSIEPSE